jgi:hypothetical protein
MDYLEILKTKPCNEFYINHYKNFIEKCRIKNKFIGKSIYCEVHHICPKAKDLFPEYKNIKEFPWNGVVLTFEQHIIAHILLTKIYPKNFSMSFSLTMMVGDDNKKYKTKYENFYYNRGFVSALDENGKIIRITTKEFYSGNYVGNNKGKVVIKDENGTTRQISKEEFDSGNYDGVNKGFVVILNDTECTKRISKEEFDSGNYITPSSGFVVALDENGKIIRIKSDEFYSNIFVGISKGKVVIKDENGTTRQISKEEFDSGNYDGVNKGFVIVKDENGNNLRINKENIHEYEHVNKGKVIIKDENGTTRQISKEEFDSGNYNGTSIGMVSAIDMNGNRVYITIEEFKTGLYSKKYKGKTTVRSIHEIGVYNIIFAEIKPHEIVITRKEHWVYNPTTKEEKILNKNETVDTNWLVGKLPLYDF